MESFMQGVYNLGLAQAIRDSLFLFPLIESAHVIAITLVFGTIAVVDLRLLGVASGHRPFTKVAPELLKWTWMAFGLAVITGALMFISNAVVYFNNFPFRLKMVLMALAGVNMIIFQVLYHDKTIHLWDDKPAAPNPGKIAAILSLCLWMGVIGAGRWIGFTSTQKATEAAPPPSVDFDDFLSGSDSSAPPPPAPVAPPAPGSN